MKRESYTAKQLAREMSITPRQLRKFFRTQSSTDKSVGRGQRYEFPAAEVPRIQEEYHAWRVKIERENKRRHGTSST